MEKRGAVREFDSSQLHFLRITEGVHILITKTTMAKRRKLYGKKNFCDLPL